MKLFDRPQRTPQALARCVVLAAALVAGCQDAAPEEGKASAPAKENLVSLSAESARLAQIKLATAGPATLSPRLEFQGDVKLTAEQSAKVVARVNGIVQRVTKQEGDQVRRGEGLAVVESRELGQAGLAFDEAQRQVKFTRAALEREEQLLAKKISAKEQYLQRKQEHHEAVHSLEAARQRLKMVGMSAGKLSHSSAKSYRMTLTSPIQGTVIKRVATLGQAVTEGSELFEIADLSRLAVEFRAPAVNLPLLTKGQSVALQTKLALKGEGKITWIAPVVNPDTRTVLVRVTVENKEGRWRPGICSKVVVAGAQVKVGLAVPLDALQEIDNQPAVFVQQSPGQFQLMRVKTGRRDLERVEVVEGLRPGQRVAAKNSLALKAALEQQGGE